MLARGFLACLILYIVCIMGGENVLQLGKIKKNIIIIETIVDKSLWIWHWFFRLPSGNTYLNVLNKSLGEWC